MRESHKLILDASANLIGHISRLLAVFLLPPLVISIIGKDSYGLIVIATTVLSILNLVQIGTPNSLSRFLSESLAIDDSTGVKKILASGTLILSCSSLVALIFTLFISIKPDYFIAIPNGLSISTVRSVLLIIGALAAISLPLSIGNVLFYVKGKFGILNFLQILGTFIRVLLVLSFVWIFKSSIAYVTGHAIASIATSLIVLLVGVHYFKGYRFHFSLIDKSTIKKVLGYGLAVFVYSSLYLLYIQADYLIIGKTIDSASVTIFNLAVVWGTSLRGIIVAVASVSAPSASRHNATDDIPSLKTLLIRITKYSLIVGMPAVLFLCVFRENLMLNWMGKGFDTSAALMIPILLGEVFAIAEAGGTQIYLGIGKIRYLTVTNVLFGIFNVILCFMGCVFFDFKLMDIAFIYMLLLFIRSGILTPRYMAKELGISFSDFYRKSYMPPILGTLAATPFVLLLHLVFPLNGWFPFILALLFTLLIYLPLTYCICLDSYDRGVAKDFLFKIKHIFYKYCSYT